MNTEIIGSTSEIGLVLDKSSIKSESEEKQKECYCKGIKNNNIDIFEFKDLEGNALPAVCT